MRILIAATSLALLATTVYAQQPAPAQPSCKLQSDTKKLAGAAQKSFMSKCQKDAQTACDKAAADKKLAGAAKTSFTKKCLSDAVGT